MLNDVSVLVVDDSIAICRVLDELLQSLGVSHVSVCHDGESALSKVSSNPVAYDAIFIDLHMEGMDGLELISQLHEIRYHGGIIVMSALESKILEFTLEVISNYNLRVLGSVEKPFEKSLIAFMIKRIKSFIPPYAFVDTKLLKRREVMEAIQAKRILCYFQPKINAVTNKVSGVECLVRIKAEDGSIVSPQSFIPVAEKFDLIGALTDAIFEAAIPDYLKFIEYLGEHCNLSINISPKQLYSDSLPDILNEYVAKYGLNKSKLFIEITENYALRDDSQLKNLNRLSIHGFRLSLDDYGAGYTNLRQLKNIPFKEIKIDAQLIAGISRDRVLQVIVESIRKVTTELNVKLVAEGVEESRDLAVLDKIGIDTYQGFLFCRPKPIDELIRWHNNWLHINTAEDKLQILPPSKD